MDKSVPEPPTAVLLHGILGSRKNWGRYYHMGLLGKFLGNHFYFILLLTMSVQGFISLFI